MEMSKILTDPIFAETSLGRQVKEDIRKGRLIHDSVVIYMLQRFLDSSNDERLVIDGFPRTLVQARFAVEVIGRDREVRFFLYDLDDEDCINRVIGRKASGEDRDDDDLRIHRDRLVYYRRSERRIKSFLLTRMGEERVHIQWAGLPPEEIHQQVQNVLSAC